MVLEIQRVSMTSIILADKIAIEFTRRCFWACWIANSINSDNYVVGTSVDPQVLALPLPITDRDLHDDGSIAECTLAELMCDGIITSGVNIDARPSIMAELIKNVLLW
jgi:hypothetical protein